jgi:hypothetical protein
MPYFLLFSRYGTFYRDAGKWLWLYLGQYIIVITYTKALIGIKKVNSAVELKWTAHIDISMIIS